MPLNCGVTSFAARNSRFCFLATAFFAGCDHRARTRNPQFVMRPRSGGTTTGPGIAGCNHPTAPPAQCPSLYTSLPVSAAQRRRAAWREDCAGIFVFYRRKARRTDPTRRSDVAMPVGAFLFSTVKNSIEAMRPWSGRPLLGERSHLAAAPTHRRVPVSGK
jgi:hypothetical protein